MTKLILHLVIVLLLFPACVRPTEPTGMKFKNNHSEAMDVEAVAERDLQSIKESVKKIERVNAKLTRSLDRYQSCNALCEKKVRRLGVRVKKNKKKPKESKKISEEAKKTAQKS